MQSRKISTYIHWICFVMVLIFISEPASGCVSNRDCGFRIKIGNGTIYYPDKICCAFQSPKRCMTFSACYSWKPVTAPKTNNRPWPDTWPTPWTYKPITIDWSDFTVQPFTFKLHTQDYTPSESWSNTPLVIALIVVFVIVIIPIAMCYRYCSARTTPGTVLSASTQNTQRNGRHVVVVIAEQISRVNEATEAEDEPPSYESAVSSSAQQQNDLSAPPRYEDSILPPPPRYEESELSPPPSYEDTVSENTMS